MFHSRAGLIVLLLLSCVTAVIVGCVWAGAAPNDKQTTSVEPAKFVSIYDDEGVIYQKNTFGDGSKQLYDRMLRHTTSAGHSNVLLVQGRVFEDALLDTDKILFGFQQADTVNRNTERDCWLFVSLGATLSWKRDVGSVQIDRKNRVITFEYEPDGTDHGGFFRGYAYWVPLGRLETGEYTLDLLPKGWKRPAMSWVVNFRDL